MKKIKINFRYGISLISLIIGVVLGILLKEKATILRPIGDIFINLMFTIVVPLIFLTISSNVSKFKSYKKLKSLLIKTFIVFACTGVITGIFTLISGLIFNPLGNSNIVFETYEEIKSFDAGQWIVNLLTVDDFSKLASKSNIVPLIVFSILFGISTGLAGKKAEKVSRGLEIGYEIIIKFVNMVMWYAPIALCAYFAAIIGEYGPSFLGTYARISVMYLVLGVVNIIVFHTIYLYAAGGKDYVKEYYKNISIVGVTALSTQSSVATMPTNMETVKKIGVSDSVRSISLPLGTVLNMQGNIIQTTLKIILLYSLFDMPFDNIFTFSMAISVAMLTSVVSGGVPGGGVMGNMMLISIYNFPLTAFPIITAIEWILDAPATAMNVLGNTSTMPLIDKFFKKMEG